MADVPTRPAGMPWLLPMLTVADGAKAIDFYESAFGFTRGDVMTDDTGRVTHGDVVWNDARVMFAPADPLSPAPSSAPAVSGVNPPVLLYVYCEDVDALFARATSRGAAALSPPTDMPWGDRMCSLKDPDGHFWSFATHIGFGEQPRA
jgi:PhnB protein